MGAQETQGPHHELSTELKQAAADLMNDNRWLDYDHNELNRQFHQANKKLNGQVERADLGKGGAYIDQSIKKASGVPEGVTNAGDAAVSAISAAGAYPDINHQRAEKTSEAESSLVRFEKSGAEEITQIDSVIKNIDSLEGKKSQEIRDAIDFIEDEITLRKNSIEKGVKIVREEGKLVEEILGNEDVTKLNNEITQLREKLATLTVQYISLEGENKGLSKSEVLKYSEIEVGEFLRNLDRGERLKFVTKEGVSGDALSVGKNKELTITFTYGGVLNSNLKSQITAGQILPKDVGEVQVDGKIYARQGLLGEFVSGKERLKIIEGTHLTNISYRDDAELTKLEDIGDYEENIIKQEAAKRNIDPDMFEDIVKEALNSIGDGDYKKAALEEELANFDRMMELYGVLGETITAESVQSNPAHKSVIAGLFRGIYGKHQGWYGSRQHAKGADAYSERQEQRLSYLEQNYDISSEIIGISGMGQKMVQHLANRNFRPYTNRASNCGRNCGEALLDMGIPNIPKSGRHGYKWAGFLENHSHFTEVQCDAEHAPPGSVISYDRGTGGSPARETYGHVEIALGNGEFWFGKKLPRPGGSDKNPTRGEYRVFAPIGSVVGEKKEEKVDDKKAQEKENKTKEVQVMSEKFKSLDKSIISSQLFGGEALKQTLDNFSEVKKGAIAGFERLAKKGELSKNTPVTVFSLNKVRERSVGFHYSPDSGKIIAIPIGYGKDIGTKNGSNKTPLGSFEIKSTETNSDNGPVDLRHKSTSIRGAKAVKVGLDGKKNSNSMGRGILLHGVTEERAENIKKGEHSPVYDEKLQTGTSEGCIVSNSDSVKKIVRSYEIAEEKGFTGYEEAVFIDGGVVKTADDADSISGYYTD